MELIQSYRICVYVPEEALEDFVQAVSPEIPAFLGTYDHVCWWSAEGTEQSRRIGEEPVERVPCRRFECSLPLDEAGLARFITEIVIPAHPWEEPVILVRRTDIVKRASRSFVLRD